VIWFSVDLSGIRLKCIARSRAYPTTNVMYGALLRYDIWCKQGICNHQVSEFDQNSADGFNQRNAAQLALLDPRR
jgi:hypothetical protein